MLSTWPTLEPTTFLAVLILGFTEYCKILIDLATWDSSYCFVNPIRHLLVYVSWQHIPLTVQSRIFLWIIYIITCLCNLKLVYNLVLCTPSFLNRLFTNTHPTVGLSVVILGIVNCYKSHLITPSVINKPFGKNCRTSTAYHGFIFYAWVSHAYLMKFEHKKMPLETRYQCYSRSVGIRRIAIVTVSVTFRPSPTRERRTRLNGCLYTPSRVAKATL